MYFDEKSTVAHFGTLVTIEFCLPQWQARVPWEVLANGVNAKQSQCNHVSGRASAAEPASWEGVVAA